LLLESSNDRPSCSHCFLKEETCSSITISAITTDVQD
jgi:hypothetical protein